MKKKFIIALICIFAVVILFTVYVNIIENSIIGGVIQSVIPPGKMTMSRYFRRDQNDLELISEYFIDSGYSQIYIARASYIEEPGIMYTGLLTGDVEIKDDAILNAIDRLFTKWKYDVISRSGNTIDFQKWSNLDNGRGITYSINGENETSLDFLTKLKPLSKCGWYYYEEDYNEWRANHKDATDS